MRGLAVALITVLAVAVLAPLASAGTPEDPEITDNTGDSYYGNGVVPVNISPVGFRDIDLTLAWVLQDNKGKLELGLQVFGEISPVPLLVDNAETHFNWYFLAGQNAQDENGVPFHFEAVASGGGIVAVTPGVEMESSGNVLIFRMDDDILPVGTKTLYEFYVTTVAVGPLPTTVFDEPNDRAPDAGYGNHYNLWDPIGDEPPIDDGEPTETNTSEPTGEPTTSGPGTSPPSGSPTTYPTPRPQPSGTTIPAKPERTNSTSTTPKGAPDLGLALLVPALGVVAILRRRYA